MWGEMDTSGADSQTSTTENHGNFPQMFESSSSSTSSGSRSFDKSYATRIKENRD